MTTQWKKFSGSEDQISEMMSAAHGFKFKRKDRNTEYHYTGMHKLDWSMIDSYLICERHPHAEMIIEWARTGREAYAFLEDFGQWKLDVLPVWHPNVKYSFHPDGDGNEK